MKKKKPNFCEVCKNWEKQFDQNAPLGHHVLCPSVELIYENDKSDFDEYSDEHLTIEIWEIDKRLYLIRSWCLHGADPFTGEEEHEISYEEAMEIINDDYE